MLFIQGMELDDLRTEILGLLPDTCDILTVSRSPDGHGGTVDNWQITSASVACRLDYRTGQEIVSGGAIQSYQAEMLTVPWNTVITEKSIVRKGGYDYQVLSVSEGSGIAVKRVSLERMGLTSATWMLDFSQNTNSMFIGLF